MTQPPDDEPINRRNNHKWGDQCKRLGEQTLRGALRSILISGHQVHKFSQLMSANANQKGEN